MMRHFAILTALLFTATAMDPRSPRRDRSPERSLTRIVPFQHVVSSTDLTLQLPGWHVVSPPIVTRIRRSQTPPLRRSMLDQRHRSASMPHLGQLLENVPAASTATITPYTDLDGGAEVPANWMNSALTHSWLSNNSPQSDYGRPRRQSSDDDLLRMTPFRSTSVLVRVESPSWAVVRAALLDIPCLALADTVWTLWNEHPPSDTELTASDIQAMSECIGNIDRGPASVAWLHFSRSLRKRVAAAAITNGTFLGLSADPRMPTEYLWTRSDVRAVQGLVGTSVQLVRQWNTYHGSWFVPAGSVFMSQLTSICDEVHAYESLSSILPHEYQAALKLDKLASAPEVSLLATLPNAYFAPPAELRFPGDPFPWTPELETFALALPQILESADPDIGDQLADESCLVFQAWILANGGMQGAPANLEGYLVSKFLSCVTRASMLDLTVFPMLFYRILSKLDGELIDYTILDGFFYLVSAFDVPQLDAAARLRAAAASNLVPGWFRSLQETPVRITDMFPAYETLTDLEPFADLLALCSVPFLAATHVPGWHALANQLFGEGAPERHVEVDIMIYTLEWLVGSVEQSDWLGLPPWQFIAEHLTKQPKFNAVDAKSVLAVCRATELTEHKEEAGCQILRDFEILHN